MDTGVDWLHPALTQNYRGNLGKGLVDHHAAWFDAVNGGTYPYDDHGHGTHVAGTATGRGNIGVAPAARWIGVKVLAGNGYGYDSWIHAGFQWLLAPGGDPARAPDVVNSSWSSENGAWLEFAEDVERLHQAGIVPLFAAGNKGPAPKTVGSPASNPGVFAIGAGDPDGDVAIFSSRGPSPWGEVKPLVIAPGVDVRSSLPGGIYGTKNGTSMATPHVAGLVALLRSADPTLSVADVTRAITQTAVPLTTTIPNNDSGWGRIDAFAAVATVIHPAIVTGTVENDNKQTIAGADVVATPSKPLGNPAQTSTTGNGSYSLALTPALYDITASAFGYLPQTQWHVTALTDTHQQLDFRLHALPAGTIRGRLTVSGTAEPPTGTVVVRALGTPVTATATLSGNYALTLPAGVYTVEVRGLSYRVAAAAITVTAGMVTLYDFALVPAPTLLLVDEGAWYYGSQIHYWQATLDNLGYTYDLWRLKYPPDDTPSATALSAYDVVLWSSPQGSPGLVAGGDALSSYLRHGGRLLLSGQDVAYFDGGGTLFSAGPQSYLMDTLSVIYAEDNAPSRQLTGLGPFSGITATIEGGMGADNQLAPDEVKIVDSDKAMHLWQYAEGGLGGVGTSVCVPYRALFFAFGYEAIAGEAQRQAVMARSLDWLATPPLTTGLTLERIGAVPGIGLAGERVTHTMRLRHIGYAGGAAPVTLTIGTTSWPATVTPHTATLTPCASLYATVVVTIPMGTGIDARDVATLTVDSPLLPAPAALTLTTKTPAPVLLVDDDRWYPMEARYTSALRAAGIPFDTWDNADSAGGLAGATSPTTDVVRRYPIVVWFTGYDWFAPVLPAEETLLLDYLAHGGRLLLSSQDYLYYHTDTPLTQRFGVLDWDEGLNPTTASGVPGHLAGGTWGPVALDFPFRNFADTVEPAPGAQPVMRGQAGQPLAVSAEGGAGDGSRTLFYGFPLEALPDAARTRSLTQAVDWLGPLGSSRWTLTPTVPAAGARITNTLVLRNDAPSALPVTFAHTLPGSLSPVAGTFSPALHYDAASRSITWAGSTAPQAPLTFTWAVTVAGAPGDAVPLTLTLGLPEWGMAFERGATLHVAGAELSASAWLSPAWASVRAGDAVTLAFALRNDGPGGVSGDRVRLWATRGSTPLTASQSLTQGWGIVWWEGDLAPGETRVLTVPLRAWRWDKPLRVDAILEDNAGQRWERRRWLTVEPWVFYLPVVLRSGER